MNKWINIICYQAAWLVAVIGAAHDQGWIGPVAVGLFAILQFTLSNERGADVRLVLVAAAVGFAIDSLFARSGTLHYAAAVPWVGTAPAWIVALWINFALTLNHAMAYLKTNLVLASLLGAIGGPLAYWGAATGWHAIEFPDRPAAALLALAIVWALVTPLLCMFAQRLTDHGASAALKGAAS